MSEQLNLKEEELIESIAELEDLIREEVQQEKIQQFMEQTYKIKQNIVNVKKAINQDIASDLEEIITKIKFKLV